MFPTKKFKVKVKKILTMVLYEKGKIIISISSLIKRNLKWIWNLKWIPN